MIRRRLGRWAGWMVGAAWALSVFTAQAESTPATCPPVPEPFSAEELQAAPARDHGLLWRLDKDGRTSYLYGTIHVARREWARPGPVVRSALQSVDHAAFELNLLDPDVLARLQRAAQQPPGAPRLPAEEARQIAQAARHACVQGRLDGLRPELQVVTLVSLALRQDGFDPAWGIDHWLMREATSRGLRLVSLETPEQQVSLMVHEQPAAVLTAVRQGLRELQGESSRAVVRRLVEAWANSRTDELETFAQWCACQDTEADRAQHRATVDARNPAMADRLATLHQRGHTVFAAVGALHMVGEAGLPQQMARRGFTVVHIPLQLPLQRQ